MRTTTWTSRAAWVAGVWLMLPAWAGPSASAALERLTKGDAPGARREYEALLSRAPSDPRLAFNAGVAAHQMGDWEAAGRHHEAALASPDLGLQQRAFFGLGSARFRQGEAATDGSDKARLWEEAARHYQAALGLNPADTAARSNLEAVREQLARLQQEQRSQDGKKDPKQQDGQKDDPKDAGKDSKKDSQKGNAGEKGEKGENGEKSDPKQDGGQTGGDEPDAGAQGDKKGSGKGQKSGDPKKDGASQPPDGAGRKEGQDGGKDGKEGPGGRMEENKGKESAGTKPGQRGKDGKEGDRTPRSAGGGQGEGGEGEGLAMAGQPGSASGEDAADGKMALRFAERLLDAHKREERALIWSAPRNAYPDARNAGRKTW